MTVDESAVLDERYALDELIGRGGMADVYRGTDQVLLRPVAVKVLRETADPGQRERFISEARTLASLNHPGLVTLLDAGILIDRPYLVMALATGPTLSECIAQGPLELERVREVGRQLATALAYAHAQGVVHRDVKPSNVLLCDDDRVLLADFGIARLIGEAQHQTKTGEAIGSPAYLAPEQVAGEELDAAADVFSLGLVLLEALTAERAYTGTPIEAAVARLHTPPAIPDHLDPRWRELVARMTDRDAASRPTAAEVANDLASPTFTAAPVVAGDPSADTGALDLSAEGLLPDAVDGPTGDAPVASGRRPRRRVWVWTGAALVGLAVLVSLLVTRPWDRSGTAGPAEPAYVVPTGVPSRMHAPLQDLHRAIEGHHS